MGQLLDKEVGGMKMKIGIIISNTDPELVWNALRFANTATLEEHYGKSFCLEPVLK
jgi:hypothetical protein